MAARLAEAERLRSQVAPDSAPTDYLGRREAAVIVNAAIRNPDSSRRFLVAEHGKSTTQGCR